MSRKKRANKRKEAVKDVKYSDPVVEMLINKIMWDGKKTLAASICYNAMEKAGEKFNVPPLEALQKSLDNIRPLLEVKSRRVGGATYQVPVEVSRRRGMLLAIRWLVIVARQKKGSAMNERLAAELIAAYKGEGSAVKKREDTHRMAEANKAFAHYRW